MNFPNYSSAFSNTKFNSFTPVAFGEKTGSLSKGAGMAFDPFTLGLGALNIGASLFGAKQAEEAYRQNAQGQLNAAANKLEIEAMLGRERGYGQAGQETAARNAQGTWMPDLELGRQMFARNKELREFAPVQMAFNTEGIRRGFDLNASAAAREQSQRENREALKRSLAEKEGAMAGMFGRIAPRDVGTMFV